MPYHIFIRGWLEELGKTPDVRVPIDPTIDDIRKIIVCLVSPTSPIRFFRQSRLQPLDIWHRRLRRGWGLICFEATPEYIKKVRCGTQVCITILSIFDHLARQYRKGTIIDSFRFSRSFPIWWRILILLVPCSTSGDIPRYRPVFSKGSSMVLWGFLHER